MEKRLKKGKGKRKKEKTKRRVKKRKVKDMVLECAGIERQKQKILGDGEGMTNYSLNENLDERERIEDMEREIAEGIIGGYTVCEQKM